MDGPTISTRVVEFENAVVAEAIAEFRYSDKAKVRIVASAMVEANEPNDMTEMEAIAGALRKLSEKLMAHARPAVKFTFPGTITTGSGGGQTWYTNGDDYHG